jgi:putative ABC transport system permease protein
MSTAEIIRETLQRFHKEDDYEIIVPLQLLSQARQTKRIFNIVLGSIAAISLLVGGIGIMNIMLATVTERTREIGIRRALGAKRSDIITQFLMETILLSGCGGTVGLLLGILLPFLISHFAGMETIIRLWSLICAFGISILIGLIFGLYPAYRAAVMNPITALRHE